MFEEIEPQRLRARRYLFASLTLWIAGVLGWSLVWRSGPQLNPPDYRLIFLKAVAADVHHFTEIPCLITESQDPLVRVLPRDTPGQHDRITVPVLGLEFVLHRAENVFAVFAYGAPEADLLPVPNPVSNEVLASYGIWPSGDLKDVRNHWWPFQGSVAHLFMHVHSTVSSWVGGGKPHDHPDPAPGLEKALMGNFKFLYFGTLIAALVGMISAAVSCTRLLKLYRKFSAGDLRQRLGLWRFVFSSDSVTLARQELKRLATIRAEQVRNRELQEQRRRLDAQLAELRDQFDKSSGEWQLADRASGEDSPPSQKREAIAILERRLSQRTATDIPNFEEAREIKATELIALYQHLAAGEPDPQAQARFALAMQATEWKQKRDLLQDAIAIQRDANRAGLERVADPPVAAGLKPPEPEADVRYVRLLEMVDREFPDLAPYLPPRVSSLIVREIIVRFVNPGTGASTFGATYFPETNLKKGVGTRMRMRGLPFSPKEFWQALNWLVSQGIVLKHEKSPEQTYSMNPTTTGLGPNAAEIVKAVVNFSLKFKEPG